ncbi:MAG: LTA synthase family protein, partial [Clostridia bacterium]|nr:LTA synthase family protein [Clostridia bacterium]
RLFPVTVGNAVRRCAGAAVLLLCYVAGLGGAYSTPVLWSAYETEYNFSAAVGHFGLLTGVRLDIKHGLFGKDDAFELMGEPDSAPESEPGVSEEPGDAGEDTPPTGEYGYNQLPLELNGGTGQVADLNSYVASLAPSRQNAYTGLFKGKNLIMITAEAFTAEVIDPVLTPTLYRLATQGIQFTDYYQPASAGTTGGEYQHVFGMLPMAGGMSFKNTASTLNYMTMGSQLDRLGYYGKAFHNNSYTYYSRHLTHVKLGYSDGFMGYGNGMEAYVRSLWPQSDLEMFAGTLPTYIGKQPFNVYYMTVSGHGGYSRVGNSMTNKNWDRVAHLTCSDPVKGYLAANLELEYAMAYVVNALEEAGIADDTVICLTTDHFPYGLDKDGKLGNMPYLSELYGHAVDNYFQRDHSQWILWCGALEEQEPIVVDTPTFSLDILPTLSNLFGTEFDSRLFPGRDVFSDAEPLVFNTNYDWKTVYGTYAASNGKFVPANPEAELPEGYVDRIKAIVRNKIRYCEWAPANDYFRHLFG